MKVEIKGHLLHVVPNPKSSCTLPFDHSPDIKCFFYELAKCDNPMCHEPPINYLDDEGFAKYIAARLTK